MLLRVLGPVRIETGDGATVTLGRRRERGLLALLLLEPNRVVPTQHLYDLLWDDEPPPSARHALHNHVAAIRAALRDTAAVVSHGDAYELRVDPDLVDAHRMRRLVTEASTVEDPARRVALLDEALALWGGTPLSNAGGPRLRDTVTPALEHLRLTAVEGLMAARLDLGGDDGPGVDLTALVAAHPHRERLVELGMRALHRAGRTEEALALFDGVRERLATDLGLDPGPRLLHAHRRVTAPSSTVDTPSTVDPASTVNTASAVDPHTDALAELDKRASATGPDEVALTLLVGPAATANALARHWAATAAHRFPDGRLTADLRHGPAAALAAFLRVLGAHPPADPDGAVALYRERTAGKRLLVVLDDATHPDQVRPLLPSGGGSFVLVTTRDPLIGLVAVDGARPLRL
jgi:DNA-binding SARP family transcriptional activator